MGGFQSLWALWHCNLARLIVDSPPESMSNHFDSQLLKFPAFSIRSLPMVLHGTATGFFPGTGAMLPRKLDAFPFERHLHKLQLAAPARGPVTLSRTLSWPLCAWVSWQT